MRSVLVTRPQPVADEFAEKLRRSGLNVYIAPLMAYVDMPADLKALTSSQAIVFTSAQGVTFFTAKSLERSLPVFAVGDATAQIAQRYGFTQVYSAQGDSNDLIRLITSKKNELNLKTVLHVAGDDTAQDLAKPLKENGIDVQRTIVYKAELLNSIPGDVVNALEQGQITTVTLFSARTAANFVKILKSKKLNELSQKLEAVCISDRVANELRELNWRTVRIAANPNSEAVLNLLITNSDQKSLRQRGEDRRKNRAPIDEKGFVHHQNYTGPNRRSGIDRRAYNERQQQRVREARMSFISRSVVMGAFFLIAILYAGALLLAPEVFQLTNNKDLIKKMEQQIDSLKSTLDSLHNNQKNMGGMINNKIEQIQNVTDDAAVTVQAAMDKASPYYGTEYLTQILSEIGNLGKTSAGRAALAGSISNLNAALSGQLSPQKIQAVISNVMANDPTLNTILNQLNDKDLRSAAMLFAMDQLRASINGQSAFESELALLQKLTAPYPQAQKILNTMAPYARTGVHNYDSLQGTLKDLAIDIVTAKLEGQDLSVKDEMMRRFSHLVKIRKIDDIAGNSTDAIVARAQVLLDQGDVKGAIRELKTLDGAPGKAAAGWINDAESSLNTTQSTDQLTGLLLQQLSQTNGMSLQGLFGNMTLAPKAAAPYISPAMGK